MNIEGTYTLHATPAEVWLCLTDQEILSKTVPGVKRIVSVGKDIYDVTISMDNAPFTGSHHGQITISEQQYPYQFRLSATSDGKTNLHGVGTIHLHEHNHQTIVVYKGTFTTNKTSSHLSPALVKGAIKLYMQRYFQSLAEHLHNHTPLQVAQGADIATNTTQQSVADIVIPHPAADDEYDSNSKGVISKTVRLFRPGAHDPQIQARWKRRIRRTGIITGLLVLVWIGTKLPRRQP